MSNEAKSALLDLNFSTASQRLRKLILFDLLQRFGQDNCFRCGEQIEGIDDLSIEHKESWQSAPDPKAAFFDLENIAFSHLRCNVGAGARPTRLTTDEKRRHRNEYNKGLGRNSRNRRHIAWQQRYPEKHNANSRAWYWRRGRSQRQKNNQGSGAREAEQVAFNY